MAGRQFITKLIGTAAVAATVLVSGAGAAPAADTIKIGGIFDITGATSDVGADYAVAAKDAVAYINANGGDQRQEARDRPRTTTPTRSRTR